MTVESDLFDTLKGLVSNRVFPDVAPFDTARPYITYQQIGGRAVSYVDNATPDRKNGYFQINVWAETRLEAAALALQVETALCGTAVFAARPIAAPIATHEPDLNRYGTMQDFTIWSAR